LFVANGVQQTSTAAIAREAGAAAGTLFLYFPTKQDLIDELVLEIGKEQSAYIHSLLDPSLSVRDTFYTIWKGSIRWFLDHRDAYQFNQQVRDTSLVSAAVVAESGEFFDYYFQAVHKGLAEGRIKPYPLELVGGFLYQDIVAVMNVIGAQSNRARQDKHIEDGFNIFWNGIKTGDA
jgi:AcrR family transcriptional regulator